MSLKQFVWEAGRPRAYAYIAHNTARRAQAPPVWLAVRSEDDPFLRQPRGGAPPVQPHIDETRSASPPPAHPVLPRPTYWPAALAFGITLLAWGILTSLLILIVGVLVIFVAIGGWIGELLHEH